MKRLFRIPSALTRLAFWRKPAATVEAAAPAEAEARPVAYSTEQTTEADREAEPAPPSFLARLTAKLRPRPRQPAQAAEAESGTAPDEADVEDGQDAPRGLKRALALLSRKSVWIPALSLVLLAAAGTLSVLLWQAGQDRTALQAKLKAAERQLQQTTTTKPRPATQQAAPASPGETAAGAVAAVTPTADPRPDPTGGDCDLRNAESVALQLKDCIDVFNDESSRRPVPAASR